MVAQDEEGPYRGKYLGKINSYHHQVSGDVYAADEYRLLLTKFNYDGNGVDTFFWAGAANRPGPQGFIVPDENGKCVLQNNFPRKNVVSKSITVPTSWKSTSTKTSRYVCPTIRN